MQSFLRSNEVQRLFIKEPVQGTFAEAMRNPLRSVGIHYLIEAELMGFRSERREDLLDRMAERLLKDAARCFERTRHCASADLNEMK